MAAALGKALILDLDRVRAGLLEQPHRALDVERIAIAVVGIDDQIGVDPIADQRNRFDHLGDADQPDVRPPQPRIGDRSTRNIERMEAGLRCEQAP